MCFKREDFPSESNGSEFKEDKLSEDLIKFKGDDDDSKDLKKDWLAALHTVLLSFFTITLHGNKMIGNYSFAISHSIKSVRFLTRLASFIVLYPWLK